MNYLPLRITYIKPSNNSNKTKIQTRVKTSTMAKKRKKWKFKLSIDSLSISLQIKITISIWCNLSATWIFQFSNHHLRLTPQLRFLIITHPKIKAVCLTISFLGEVLNLKLLSQHCPKLQTNIRLLLTFRITTYLCKVGNPWQVSLITLIQLQTLTLPLPMVYNPNNSSNLNL